MRGDIAVFKTPAAAAPVPAPRHRRPGLESAGLPGDTA